jgi:hypothetical protein
MDDIAVVTLAQGDIVRASLTSEVPCSTWPGAEGSMPMSYVHALSRIEPRFSAPLGGKGVCPGHWTSRDCRADRSGSAS